jgi:polyphenol oxidase
MTAARTGAGVARERGNANLLDDVGKDSESAARLERRGRLDVLVWPALARLGANAVITTRSGGASIGPYESLNLALHVGDDPGAVIDNRRRAAAALGAGLDDCVLSNQVHGTRAAVVTAADRGRGSIEQSDAIGETDALVTSDVGSVLVTLVADCVPVVLFDPDARVLACAHAGWRGALSGVLEETITAMRTLGAAADRVVAGIGPSVAQDRYQVGPEVFEAAKRALGGAVATLAPPDGTGRWLLDLEGSVRYLLERAGVDPGSCLGSGFSTGGPFFSDRAVRPCGRFGLLAVIAP